jgi:signal transduction histidine kinase
VKDDGIGFDTGVPRLARHGLIGMRYRVEAEGGTMELASSPGAGTLIEATLPAPRAGDPAAAGLSEDVALPAAA